MSDSNKSKKTSMLRKVLDDAEPHFTRGGKLERFYVLYEMVDTLFYSPPNTTVGAPHIRDALDLKRVMGYVWMACYLHGVFQHRLSSKPRDGGHGR